MPTFNAATSVDIPSGPTDHTIDLFSRHDLEFNQICVLAIYVSATVNKIHSNFYFMGEYLYFIPIIYAGGWGHET